MNFYVPIRWFDAAKGISVSSTVSLGQSTPGSLAKKYWRWLWIVLDFFLLSQLIGAVYTLQGGCHDPQNS